MIFCYYVVAWETSCTFPLRDSESDAIEYSSDKHCCFSMLLQYNSDNLKLYFPLVILHCYARYVSLMIITYVCCYCYCYYFTYRYSNFNNGNYLY